MKITKAQLLHIMPNAGAKVGTYLPLLQKYMAEFEINTPLRAAHYLAQIAHESGELRYTEELASGAAYEGRRDLGNVYPGDGRRYKGRGLIQITGRHNYAKYKAFSGFDVLKKPMLLAAPLGAVRSSCWYWQMHGLNELADNDNLMLITKRINGGTNGMQDRKKYLERAKAVLMK